MTLQEALDIVLTETVHLLAGGGNSLAYKIRAYYNNPTANGLVDYLFGSNLHPDGLTIPANKDTNGKFVCDFTVDDLDDIPKYSHLNQEETAKYEKVKDAIANVLFGDDGRTSITSKTQVAAPVKQPTTAQKNNDRIKSDVLDAWRRGPRKSVKTH